MCAYRTASLMRWLFRQLPCMLHVTIVLYQRGVCCKMQSRDFAMSTFLHEIKYIQTRLSSYPFCPCVSCLPWVRATLKLCQLITNSICPQQRLKRACSKEQPEHVLLKSTKYGSTCRSRLKPNTTLLVQLGSYISTQRFGAWLLRVNVLNESRVIP